MTLMAKEAFKLSQQYKFDYLRILNHIYRDIEILAKSGNASYSYPLRTSEDITSVLVHLTLHGYDVISTMSCDPDIYWLDIKWANPQ